MVIFVQCHLISFREGLLHKKILPPIIQNQDSFFFRTTQRKYKYKCCERFLTQQHSSSFNIRSRQKQLVCLEYRRKLVFCCVFVLPWDALNSNLAPYCNNSLTSICAAEVKKERENSVSPRSIRCVCAEDTVWFECQLNRCN